MSYNVKFTINNNENPGPFNISGSTKTNNISLLQSNIQKSELLGLGKDLTVDDSVSRFFIESVGNTCGNTTFTVDTSTIILAKDSSFDLNVSVGSIRFTQDEVELINGSVSSYPYYSHSSFIGTTDLTIVVEWSDINSDLGFYITYFKNDNEITSSSTVMLTNVGYATITFTNLEVNWDKETTLKFYDASNVG